MDTEDRKIKILQAIIHQYIETGEPVGSRTIAKNYSLGVSSATIRNEMSDLEDLGFLEHLHSSSGRIPSDKGYRLYVDKLMTIPKLSEEEEFIIRTNLINETMFEVDKLVKQTIELLSDMTKLICIVKIPSLKRSYLKHIQINIIDRENILITIVTDSGLIKNVVIKNETKVSEEDVFKLSNFLNENLKNKTLQYLNKENIWNLKKSFGNKTKLLDLAIDVLCKTLKDSETSNLYLEGTSNIFNYQEYNNIENARKFLSLIEDKEKLINLLDMDWTSNVRNINVKIGTENYIEEAENCSIISAVYSTNKRPLGSIGIIGPTRMQYSKVISILKEVVKELNELIISNVEE